MKIRGTIGRINSSQLQPVVIIEDINSDIDFMPVAQARKVAARIIRAADVADAKMRLHKSKRTEL
jgi:hypothetical protein